MSGIASAPTNVSVTTTPVTGAVVLSWVNPSQIGIPAINNYVFSALPSAGITFSSVVNIAFTNINVSGLVIGTTYVFGVSVVNSAGTSAPGLSLAYTYLNVPLAPTTLSATVGSNQITLSWGQVVVSGGLPILGYTITSVPATTTTNLLAGNYSAVISGLTNGTAYTFSVTQSNSIGASPPSTVTATPLSPPGNPTKITIVSSPITSGSATISWTDPVSNGGSAITGYNITAYPSNGVSFSQPFSNPTDIYGLSLNSSYIFVVSATNLIGASPGAVSPVFNYTRVPNPPTNVNATISSGNVIVTWNPIVMSEGLPITGYVAISTPPTTTNNVLIGSFSQRFTGLTPGVAYTFTVYARNALGTSSGAVSNSVTLTTVPGTPTGITVNTDSSGNVNLTWNDPVSTGGLPITGYTVASIPSGAIFTGSTLSDNVIVTGITIGTTYIFTIYVNNTNGSSLIPGISAPFLYTSVPSPPTGVSATPGAGNAVINWTNAISSGGLSITGYIITSSPATTTATSAAGTSSFTFPGLTNGTSYTFNISARNSAGLSSPVTTNSVIPTSVPNPPTKVTATAGNTSAIVQWVAPVLTGGLPITGYIVSRLTSGSAPVSTTVGNLLYATITGLTNDTSYTFTVEAVNSKGASEDSAPSTAIIPLSTITVPGETGPLTASASVGNANPSILVSFTGPSVTGGSRIINFQYSTDNGTTYFPCNPPVTRSPIPITAVSSNGVTALVNGTTYTILIQAINASGIGAASASVTATPSASVANAPIINSITPGNSTCSVDFSISFNGGAAITNYNYSINGGSTFTAFSPAQTTSPLTISGLTNGSTYSIKINAINSAGNSSASNATSVTLASTAPSAPTSLSSSNITSSSFSVGFTPGLTGGSSITNYSFSTDNGTTFRVFSPAQTTSPLAITTQSSGAALVAGATYSVKLKGINAIGTSVASAAVSVTLSSGGPVVQNDYPVITNATYDAAGDYISIYFTPPTGIGEVTNYLFSTDGGEYSVMPLFPANVTSPIVINRMSYALGLGPYLTGEINIGINIGYIMDVYLQLTPVTANTLCKSSNTYKLIIVPNSPGSGIVTIEESVIGYSTPNTPAYGPIRFNLLSQYLTNSVTQRPDYGGTRTTTSSFINYAYSTDDGATQRLLNPPSIDKITIYRNSDLSPLSGTTNIKMYPVDSTGNIGTIVDAIFNTNYNYIYYPNSLMNQPEAPTLLSVNFDYPYGYMTITYRSNDVYPIYTPLVYFYIADSQIENFSFLTNGSTDTAIFIPALELAYNRGKMFSDSAYGNQYITADFSCMIDNKDGTYTIKIKITNGTDMSSFNFQQNNRSLMQTMFSKQFKIKVYSINSSISLPLTNSQQAYITNRNTNTLIYSAGSNSITVSYSSFNPKILLNYSANGMNVIMINYWGYTFGQGASYGNYQTLGNVNNINNVNWGNTSVPDNVLFLPFNVGSYENTVNMSIDGGNTFTSVPVTWNLKYGLKLDYTFTPGVSYDLILQIKFIDPYGASCVTGNSNRIPFTYGIPTYSLEVDQYQYSIRTIFLCNGNLTDTAELGRITNQSLTVSIDGGSTYNELSEVTSYPDVITPYNNFIYNYLNYNETIRGQWSNIEFTAISLEYNLNITNGQTYSIILKCIYDGSGTVLSTPMAYPPKPYDPSLHVINVNPIANIFSQQNMVYISLNNVITSNNQSGSSTTRYIRSSSGRTGISMFKSTTPGSSGTAITGISPIHSEILTPFQGKFNTVMVPMSNFTPGTEYYITYSTVVAYQYTFTPYLVPNAPTITSISNTTANTATIAFTPGSVDSTNNPPGGVTYLFSTDYFSTKTACNDSSGTIIITLAPGTYTIQIQAVSAAGRSASSNTVSFTMT